MNYYCVVSRPDTTFAEHGIRMLTGAVSWTLNKFVSVLINIAVCCVGKPPEQPMA
jgi:hypothetical protein